MTDKIGFIGLGQMGIPMARNLMRAGFKLRVYNRTPEKAAPLVAEGAEQVFRPLDVVTPGGVVITMLSNDAALEEVVLGRDGILEALGAKGVHLSMSTISPATSRLLAAHHGRRGTSYLAAPVFGRPEAAASKKLWIALSGGRDAKARVKPLLSELSQGTYDFGDDVGGANIAKLAGNFLIVSALEAMAEAFTLAEKNGLSRATIAEMMGETLFACPIYQNYGKAIAAKMYEPAGFKLALGLKDLTLALDAAHASHVPMPIGSVVRDRLLSSVAKGRENMDWAGLALDVSEDAGLA